ncbi:M48 family peptidase [Chlorobium phaeovibrioides]|uniref:M48 family metallopeptidase n=2 Tax=Chlorobium phaeovibrioides TaxID=1094 RepID=A0A3S0NAW2_CHLPH|nr:M48 family metallopeptidase [Chlorobium phaeovibrioides]HCD36159.1 M48 family peptidase [Chlorobium sp.]KAA6232967.1 M48 family metallopeptidase [Chlorobium phaeovibrioides]MWV53939.1 M48 family metalloprotease [Chlorobium phaeovibrioides]QEQ56640.1 M48 family metallopeptidase [Chlorobium phaeovibrioides]RTY35286.1 M48 family peptidase [Chlorobium phaeovibrioides]
MNIFGSVIAGTLVTVFLINLISTLLNLRASLAPLPTEFRDLYTDEAYGKSQAYLRETSRLSLFSSAFDLVLLFVFWFSGGFNLLDQFLRGFALGSVMTGVFYIGSLLLLQSVLSLPFTLYRTFVLEERFGFNRTTPAVFAGDLLKTLLLSVAIGAPLLALLLWFFQSAGSIAWLLAWGGITLVSLLLQYVAPAWIMPLFNRFVPLEDGELKSAITDYAAGVGFPLSGIYVIDGSKRSSKANAFFTGFGKRKRIALFDTLIKSHSVDELVAVLAHEIGHYTKKHILIGMVVSIVNMGVLFFLLSLFIGNAKLFEAFFMEHISVYGSLVFFMLLYTPVEFILSIVLQMLSRKHEYEADHFAVTTYSRGEALITALRNLSRSNLTNLTPHPLHVFMTYSHPPVSLRIGRLRRTLESSRS